MSTEHRSTFWSQLGAVALWGLLPLTVGLLLALLIPRPIVGTITLYDTIDYYTAPDLIAQLTYAREHPEVRAVVLILDSPGGTVVDTEAVYLELARLRQIKPVVTVIEGMAASGAYYLAVGTDTIYARPSSDVGNVGVIGILPTSPMVFEEIISTGPYKLWGTPRDTVLRQIEMIKRTFYQAVTLGRGAALKAGPEVVLSGQLWPGSEALRLGLVDALGTQSQGIEEAARRARITHYRVADLRALAGLTDAASFDDFFLKADDGSQTAYPREPGLYLLYIPPTERRLP